MNVIVDIQVYHGFWVIKGIEVQSGFQSPIGPTIYSIILIVDNSPKTNLTTVTSHLSLHENY